MSKILLSAHVFHNWHRKVILFGTKIIPTDAPLPLWTKSLVPLATFDAVLFNFSGSCKDIHFKQEINSIFILTLM